MSRPTRRTRVSFAAWIANSNRSIAPIVRTRTKKFHARRNVRRGSSREPWYERRVKQCIAMYALLLALLTPATCVRADEELDLATVRENVKKADGTLPPAETLTWSILRHGETEIRSGDSFRDDQTVGPLAVANGKSGGVYWRQNANGQTVEPSDRASEPFEEPTYTKLTHLTTPADVYVISKLTKNGYGSKDYVDPTTWHIVKVERVSPVGTSTTSYDDFRTTAGYTRPWHSVSSDGHVENDVVRTATGIAAGSITQAALAIPKTRRALVEFPPGRTSVILPGGRTSASKKFIVRVTIAGRGLDFLLDTGSAGIVMDRDVAQSLDLKESGVFSSAANAGRYTGSTVVVPHMNVGPLEMHDVAISTIPNLGEDEPQYKIDGLLGFDFLDAVAAKLDYVNGTVTAYDPAALVPPAGPHVIALDVRLGSESPELPDRAINGAVGSRFTIDTGGAGGLMLFDSYRRRNPSAAVDMHNSPRTTACERSSRQRRFQ